MQARFGNKIPIPATTFSSAMKDFNEDQHLDVCQNIEAGLVQDYRNNPQLTACLKKKGVTLPTTPAGQQGQGANRPQFDAKTQAAIDACRKELGLPAQGRGNGPRSGAPGTPTTNKA